MAKNKASLPDTSCPRQLFGIDLQAALEEKIDLGHQIIVMEDFNSEYGEFVPWMLNLGLLKLIEARHGKGPMKMNRSKNSPIDCVFSIANLKISKGGFLSFGKLLSDHQGVWVDIPKCILYGYNTPQPVFLSSRKIELVDPRVVENI